MDKLARLLKSIERIVKDEADDLKEDLSEFPAIDATLNYIEKYETKVAALLREQKKHFVNGFKAAIVKDDSGDTLEAILAKLMKSDKFQIKMSKYTAEFLSMTIEEFVGTIMDSVDEDVAFEVLSDRVVDWIVEWSQNLAELMKLTTHTAMEEALQAVIANGEGIEKAIQRIKNLPEFNRARARATAITEVLRANSVAAHEAYVQSPAVTQKTWKHSGAKKNKPRETHVALNGETIGLDEYFNVGGYKGLYPRDSILPASESVHCHCVLGPVVDAAILGLSKEEKLKLRDEALKEYNERWAKGKN